MILTERKQTNEWTNMRTLSSEAPPPPLLAPPEDLGLAGASWDQILRFVSEQTLKRTIFSLNFGNTLCKLFFWDFGKGALSSGPLSLSSELSGRFSLGIFDTVCSPSSAMFTLSKLFFSQNELGLQQNEVIDDISEENQTLLKQANDAKSRELEASRKVEKIQKETWDKLSAYLSTISVHVLIVMLNYNIKQ